MKTTRLFLTLAAVALLQACASMGKDECLTADWRTIGYEDGVQGLSASRISQHRSDCAKYGVTPDLKAYLAGRDQGLTEYCKPENGLRVGEAGGEYGAVCPPELESGFLAGYRQGHELFTLRAALSQVESDLRSRHDELDHARKKIEKKSAKLVAEETTTQERIKLLADIKDLSDEVNHLKQDIATLEDEHAARAADLAQFERRISGS